jgi:hypothetical protein
MQLEACLRPFVLLLVLFIVLLRTRWPAGGKQATVRVSDHGAWGLVIQISRQHEYDKEYEDEALICVAY